jgi:tRNA pseudouridine55 synthase
MNMNIVINLNKPKDISSQQAVTRVKRFYKAKKAGHAGTLDPMATGVLLICLHEATKITRFLSDLDKEYLVRLKLGERTNTYDATGTVLETKNIMNIGENKVRHILQGFIGEIRQVPPMYSALKMNGKPLYKLARKGIDIPRKERAVTIHDIALQKIDIPYVEFRAICSKGTYIRTLCDDIGRLLGVGAHMVSLERTRIGKFTVEDAASLDEIGFKECTHTLDSALSHLEYVVLDHREYTGARNGRPFSVQQNGPLYKKIQELQFRQSITSRFLRLKGPEDETFGIGKLKDREIIIERLFNE